ncbi:MAG: heavy metal sensor histidine kinase [Planctomycetes bacterium]|nr:heavy metal sensor histidine kinase [Planctomycetota bacterium]
MNILARSVRFRLTVWFVVALFLIILAFSLGIYTFVRSSLWKQMDHRLNDDLVTIETLLREEPDELNEMGEHGTIRLLWVTQNNQLIYETLGWSSAQLGSAMENVKSDSFWFWKSPMGRLYRLKAASLHVQNDTYLLAIAQDAEPIHDSLRILAFTLIISVPCMLVLAVVGGYLLAGRVLSPIGTMASKAQEITAECLSERLPVDNPNDEFGRLAIVFNETLARLQDSFDRLRRFTADASHELRTPLTALRSVGEVGLREELDPAAHRDVIGSMLEEADRLALLVDNLLMLTRADSRRILLNPEPVNLGELVSNIIDCLQVLAEEKRQTLETQTKQAVSVKADRLMLRQAVINLMDNAIKYTDEDGRIRVTVRQTNEAQAIVEIADNGPGIAPEHREKIFERFYRVDKDRSRDQGGAGLGLAIARHVIEMNGGRIELETEVNKGSTFRIVLPLRIGDDAA